MGSVPSIARLIPALGSEGAGWSGSGTSSRPSFLELSRRRIERRELWTDTALDFHNPSEMAALIFTNNLKVSFGAFAFGITAGLGTVLLALYNGIHLGALLAACAQHELLGGIRRHREDARILRLGGSARGLGTTAWVRR